MTYQEGDLVLCTVSQIEPTTVFVKLPNNESASLIISEIAPGRIKNMREYVMPNKKIVCKILKISQGNIEVSLRRVSAKERAEVMEKYKQEQSSKSALTQLLKEKAQEVENKILKDFPSIFEFFLKVKEDSTILEKYVSKEFHDAIKKLTKKKQKEAIVKKLIKLKCFKEDGIKRIKDILTNKDSKINLTYLAAGSFQATASASNYKEANQKLENLARLIEQKSKQNFCELEIVNKKE